MSDNVKDNIGFKVSPANVVGITNIVWGCGPIEALIPEEWKNFDAFRVVLGNKSEGRVYVKKGGYVRCFVLIHENGKYAIDEKLEQKAIYAFPEPELP